ncbi:MAG: hypothetical protein HP495_13785 [Nitrospira sp.]|jgi:hypothetical protein|nr:hypothetical protein [Nitrospira sp.]
MVPCIKLIGLLLTITAVGCARSPYEHGGYPPGFSRYDVERDYAECEYKARLANEQHFYSSSSPFPFGSGPQSPADHARALHGLTSINAMRDTCLTAKGYRLQ